MRIIIALATLAKLSCASGFRSRTTYYMVIGGLDTESLLISRYFGTSLLGHIRALYFKLVKDGRHERIEGTREVEIQWIAKLCSLWALLGYRSVVHELDGWVEILYVSTDWDLAAIILPLPPKSREIDHW